MNLQQAYAAGASLAFAAAGLTKLASLSAGDLDELLAPALSQETPKATVNALFRTFRSGLMGASAGEILRGELGMKRKRALGVGAAAGLGGLGGSVLASKLLKGRLGGWEPLVGGLLGVGLGGTGAYAATR